jgi:hypothetical protein
MRTLIAFILIALLASCGAKKPTIIGMDRQVKDSVIVTRTFETYLDTIQIPSDSSTLTARLEDLKEVPVVVRSSNGRSSVSLSRKGNNITAQSNCEQMEQEITLQRELIDTQRERIEKLTITQKIDVPFVPWYWKLGIGTSLLLNLILLIAVVILFIKSNLKLPF